MSVSRSLLTAGLLMYGLLFATMPVQGKKPVVSDQEKSWQVTQQRNPDAACLKCHKPEQDGMHGKHSGAINPNNQLPITCTNCHGKLSFHHREKVKDVMRFNQPMYNVEQQNSVCMACHLPEQLQKAFWPHDVHLTKIACASCHQLHLQQDKMQTLTDKSRIQLCVDCHREQQNNPLFNPASVHLGKDKP